MGNLGHNWNTAKETTKNDTGDFVPVESGMYVMQITNAEIKEYGGNNTPKIHTRWTVLDVGDGCSDVGAVCHDFRAFIEIENMVWVQRQLQALGVDTKIVDIEDEQELLAIYDGLILQRTCVRVQVKEKDGYHNLYFKKVIEVDPQYQVDPDAADSYSYGANESPTEEIFVDSVVNWKGADGQQMTGTVVGDDEDGNPVVRIAGIETPQSITAEVHVVSQEPSVFNVGELVDFVAGPGEPPLGATVLAYDPSGKVVIQFLMDKAVMIAVPSMLQKRTVAPPLTNTPPPAPPEPPLPSKTMLPPVEEEEGTELEIGNRVVVVHNEVDVNGIVTSIIDDGTVAHIVLDGTSETVKRKIGADPEEIWFPSDE